MDLDHDAKHSLTHRSFLFDLYSILKVGNSAQKSSFPAPHRKKIMQFSKRGLHSSVIVTSWIWPMMLYTHTNYVPSIWPVYTTLLLSHSPPYLISLSSSTNDWVRNPWPGQLFYTEYLSRSLLITASYVKYNIVYLKVTNRVDLQRSHHRKKNCNYVRWGMLITKIIVVVIL